MTRLDYAFTRGVVAPGSYHMTEFEDFPEIPMGHETSPRTDE